MARVPKKWATFFHWEFLDLEFFSKSHGQEAISFYHLKRVVNFFLKKQCNVLYSRPKSNDVVMAGSVGVSNRFACCCFLFADLRCKFKLYLIEGRLN